MTRKDYVKFAESLKYTKPQTDDVLQIVQWRLDVKTVADVFASDNGRFDRGKFYDAVGFDENVTRRQQDAGVWASPLVNALDTE